MKSKYIKVTAYIHTVIIIVSYPGAVSFVGPMQVYYMYNV